eukprot:3742995-Prymnesium_polylepis.2
MQLYSKEKEVSQPIEGHAAAFHSYTCEGATSPSTLFTYAAKTTAGAKVRARPGGAALWAHHSALFPARGAHSELAPVFS